MKMIRNEKMKVFFQTHSRSLYELANKEKNVDIMDKHLFILKSSQPACTW